MIISIGASHANSIIKIKTICILINWTTDYLYNTFPCINFITWITCPALSCQFIIGVTSISNCYTNVSRDIKSFNTLKTELALLISTIRNWRVNYSFLCTSSITKLIVCLTNSACSCFRNDILTEIRLYLTISLRMKIKSVIANITFIVSKLSTVRIWKEAREIIV